MFVRKPVIEHERNFRTTFGIISTFGGIGVFLVHESGARSNGMLSIS